MNEPDLFAPAHAHRSAPPWWDDGGALRRVVTDLLAAELAQARPGRPPPPAPWPPTCDLVRDLGADSLELLALATALAEALHLGASTADENLLAHPTLDAWIDAARAGLRARGQALTFRTSGSAGTPKRCTHTLATLWQETRFLASLLPGRRRILSAVPAHHIYGFLFTVLLPQVAGGADVVEVVDLRGASPAAALAMTRPGDLVVAHPAWWDALARLQPSFGPDVAGVSSTSPCPDALADALAAAGLRLLQVYGSSETAGVGWRDAAGAPFNLFPYWQAVDDAPELLRQLPDGSRATYPLQDKLDWAGTDRMRFLPAGRLDHAVQVGGTNVFPGYVADVLRMLPAVADCAVRLMRPDEGQRLKAFIVPRPGQGEDLAALRATLVAWVGQRLDTPERPAAWNVGPKLPRQASGKLADWIIDE